MDYVTKAFYLFLLPFTYMARMVDNYLLTPIFVAFQHHEWYRMCYRGGLKGRVFSKKDKISWTVIQLRQGVLGPTRYYKRGLGLFRLFCQLEHCTWYRASVKVVLYDPVITAPLKIAEFETRDAVEAVERLKRTLFNLDYFV